MAQAISNLSPGDQVYVQENGVDVIYDIAAFDHHAVSSVTLVRHDVYSTGTYWHENNSLQEYENSLLDQVMQSFESRYSVLHRQQLIPVSVIYTTYSASETSVLRKVFSLSYTEVGGGENGGINEGSQLDIFTDAASRSKTSPFTVWWLRSTDISETFYGYARTVFASNGNLGATLKADTRGIVPAHTVSSSVEVSDSADTAGVYSIIYPDPVPGQPILISPVLSYETINSEIIFEWQHVIDTGTNQTQADLQYSVEDGGWSDLVSVEGSDETYIAPADTLPAGNLRWRARTYNSDGVAGEWSDPAAFFGIGPPTAPSIIDTTESSRPTVSWQSVGQYGYQVQVLQDSTVVYDSGETSGVVKSLKIPIYLENGEYDLGVRIIGSQRLWSAWSTYSLTLDITPPTAPTISAALIAYGARITVSEYDEAVVKAYLLRDDVPVADITGETTYDDLAALGTARYTVRVVNSSDNYGDSNTVSVSVSVDYAVLAPVDDLSSGIVMSTMPAEQPDVTRRKTIGGTLQHYAGRKYPVRSFSEFTDEDYSPAYYYTDSADFDKLNALAERRRTVLYRDVFGHRFYGTISGLDSVQKDVQIVFTLNFSRVDYVEKIEYGEVSP